MAKRYLFNVYWRGEWIGQTSARTNSILFVWFRALLYGLQRRMWRISVRRDCRRFPFTRP